LKSNLLQLVSTPIGRGRNFIPAFGFREPSPEEDDVDTVEDETNIHQVNCKPEELVTAADGHFTVQAVPWNLNENARTVGGMVSWMCLTLVYKIIPRILRVYCTI